MGEEKFSAEIFVIGGVQGVGYRFFVEDAARELGLKGYCRNLADGRVQIEAEGNRKGLEELIKRAWKGPGRARVTDVQATFRLAQGKFTDFTIQH
ncbi:MAG TPA: acylphosphatase [Nitrospiria bacterium]|jgi:acylphosphatase|nr:acylphosphatase [Nitrospiria bacterium]